LVLPLLLCLFLGGNDRHGHGRGRLATAGLGGLADDSVEAFEEIVVELGGVRIGEKLREIAHIEPTLVLLCLLVAFAGPNRVFLLDLLQQV
jgi:hypothetical protein